MSRTKQTASLSTGGRARRASIAKQASRKTVRDGATTERWHVWLVTDRVGTAALRVTDLTRYRVEYIVAPGQVEVGYTARWILLQDGFEEYVELVDDYKANGGPQSFTEYVATRSDPFALAIGDSADGRCGFHALLRAASILGIPEWFSWDVVDTFYQERAAAGRPILASGILWTTLLKFIRQRNRVARVAGGIELCEDTLNVNQRQANVTGTNGCFGLDHLLLAPGVYLCAGYYPPPLRRSHAFLVEVTLDGRFASDDDVFRQPLVDFCFPSLAGVQFVRRLALRRM